MIGELVMVRGGDVGIVTKFSEGWLVINDDIDNVALPNDVVVIDPETDQRTLVWLARSMGVDPLKAHRVPEEVKKYASKIERKQKMSEVQADVEKLKSELAQARQGFEQEKAELDRKLGLLTMAQAKHDAKIAEKDEEIATLKANLREALLDVGKKEFAELAYEKSQHQATRDKLSIAKAQLEAIKVEANRPKRMVWQVKTFVDQPDANAAPGDAALAAALNDGWEIVSVNFSRGIDYGGRIVTMKRLVEAPAEPAPAPDAVAAAEAHIAALEEEPCGTPDPEAVQEAEVIYHISGEQKPVTLGPIAQNIRDYGVDDTIDIMNARVGQLVREAVTTEHPALSRLMNSANQFALSAQNVQ